ncbi:hypothetical protein ACFL3V_05315 [Nanoarchaeota archaeon]
MVSLTDVDNFVNSGRESLLSFTSKAPGDIKIQSIFWVIALLMVLVIIMEFRKGREERKGLIGPFAILVLCLAMIFGFSVMIIAWVVLLMLGLALITKLKKGEWKGMLLILIPIYLIGYFVSVKSYIVLIIAGLASVGGVFVKKANFARTYGTSQAARIMKDQGYPVRKERKIIKGLERISRRGFTWSKDKVLRTQAKIKQRFAQREARNIEEQEHEAEMAAAGKQLAETVEEEQKKATEMEEQDMRYIEQILRQCQELKRFVQGLDPNAVDAEKSKEILSVSKSILQSSNALVKSEMEEETVMQKANKILETCMEVIQHASDEAKQLEEKRAEFKEMKNAVDTNIRSLRKEILHNLNGLKHAEKAGEHSKAEGAHERVKLLKQRGDALNNVLHKLQEIEGYANKILNRLMKINLKEDQRIKSVDVMSDKADKHIHKLKDFASRFAEIDKQLRDEHKKFKHVFKEEAGEIPDEQLVGVTDSTIILFNRLRLLAEIAHDYNVKELKPLIADMAQVAQNVLYLSRVSEYLTKMYYRLSQAMEELGKMAEIVDQNPESKKKLAKILATEELEQKLTLRAYKKGKVIVSHIKRGYKALQAANTYTDKHIHLLDRYVRAMDSTKREVGQSLNQAFKVVLKVEIKQARQLEKEASAAESDLEKAKRAETVAKHAV